MEGHRHYLLFFFKLSFKIISVWNLVAYFSEEVVFIKLILPLPVK